MRLLLSLGMAAALALPAWPASPALAAPATVTGVTLGGTPTQVLVTASVSGPVHYRVVDGGTNVAVVDVRDAVLGIPAGTLPLARGPVRQVRVSQFQANVVRLVLDLTRPVKVAVSLSADGSALVLGVPIAAVSAGPAGAPTTIPLPPVAQTNPAVQAAPAPSGLINLELHDAEIADVLSALAKLSGRNIVTDTDVKGKITVRLVGVTFDQAMQLILQPNGLGYTMVGNNIVVENQAKLQKPFMRAYHLTNISAADFVANFLPVTGIKKEQTSVDPSNNTVYVVAAADDQAKVRALLDGVDVPEARTVTQVIKLDYMDAATFADLMGSELPDSVVKTAKIDKNSNSIVVTGSAAQIATVDALRQRVDLPLPEVLVEASVVEIPTDETKNLGVQWENPIPFNLTSTGTDTMGHLAYAVTTPSPITAQLNLLISQSKARLLANPRLAVLDGHTASMNIGSQIPFQVLSAQGVPSVVIINAGVILNITPRVNRDGNITVDLHPEVSSIATPPSNGVPPTINTRFATTSLTVKDGSSIILAGLIQKNETTATVKIPILGDIPILGWLFKEQNTTRDDNEVVFIITPHILPKVGA
jgi:type II secretory pathway component GspD/PulD (secretin)